MECLNCGHPFFGNEKYCPNCGQKNKSKKIAFKSFLVEVFNGFISWDAKFWKTLIPLLTKPGKVSKDYISGKRSRYSNPFQFYLSVSILFFIILGLTKKYNEFQEARMNIQGPKGKFIFIGQVFFFFSNRHWPMNMRIKPEN